VKDNRHINNNDILYHENFEGMSTIRHRIRELSQLIDSSEDRQLPRCIEELFEEAERFALHDELKRNQTNTF
jgi:hypothetical protein